MSSPAKKRKLNNGSTKSSATAQPKGLEYFFSKQRQNGVAKTKENNTDLSNRPEAELTDEELARKLQADWNQEVINGRDGTQERPEEGEKNEDVSDKSIAEAADSASNSDSKPTEPSTPSKPKLSSDGTKATLTLQSAGISEDTTSSSIPLDGSPLEFQPSEYVARLQEHWSSEGGDASYALLTRCFVLVSATTSRIKIVDTLVNCLRVLIEADPSSLLPAVCTFKFCDLKLI